MQNDSCNGRAVMPTNPHSNQCSPVIWRAIGKGREEQQRSSDTGGDAQTQSLEAGGPSRGHFVQVHQQGGMALEACRADQRKGEGVLCI